MLGFFKKNKPGSAYTGPPIDVDWVRNSRGKFHRLLHLDTTSEGLKGLSGVYVIWHSGVKPGWVYVGRADNLASALDAAQDNEDIDEYEINGGLYVTWFPVVEQHQNGVLRFLHDTMKPKVSNPQVGSIKDGPISVTIPKRKG
jgi:hypothetical protein